jgi:hypothetical protein
VGSLRLRLAWIVGILAAVFTFAGVRDLTAPFTPNVTGTVLGHREHQARVSVEMDGAPFEVHVGARWLAVEVGDPIPLECTMERASDVPSCRATPLWSGLSALGLAVLAWIPTLWLGWPMFRDRGRRVPLGASKL